MTQRKNRLLSLLDTASLDLDRSFINTTRPTTSSSVINSRPLSSLDRPNSRRSAYEAPPLSSRLHQSSRELTDKASELLTKVFDPNLGALSSKARKSSLYPEEKDKEKERERKRRSSQYLASLEDRPISVPYKKKVLQIK